MRNRNADWAERAVREAASLSSTAAVREHAIDFMAVDVNDLLAKAQGHMVRVGQTDARLDTAGLVVQEFEPDWRTRLLSVITDPNIAIILMMVGIYGLVFEFLAPGTMLPGTIGGICLLLGLYALALLPVSFAGLGLIFLGVGLTVAEAHSPSFGALGIGGGLAVILGATILFEMPDPIGTEFGLLSDELTYGVTLDDALVNLGDRVGVEDLNLLAISLSVQAGTGGNLVEILQNLSKALRDRTMLRAKVRAISSEGRITAIFMSVYPFLLYAMIKALSPTYFDPVWESGHGTAVVSVLLAVMAIGNVILYKMVNFEY
nr:type II secretion system F family protein [Rhizobium leguminosarum]